MATANIWNLFLPANLLGDRPVYLSGQIDQTASSVYITGTCSRSVKSERIPIIGEFITSNSKNQTRTRSRDHNNVINNQSVWVMVCESSRSILDGKVYLAGKTDPCTCVTVLYNPEDLDSSLVFAEKADDCVDTTLGRLLQVQVNRPTHIAESHGYRRRNGHRDRSGCCRLLFSLCLKVLIFVFSFIERILSVITFKWLWSRFCILTPSVMNNVTYKLNRFRRVWSLQEPKHRPQLILLDVCGQQLLDTALGVVLMLTVMCCGHSNTMATAIFTWANVTAHHLKDLLHWLMGAPAGLKLNAQLTQYLGHFFLYHVYLWAGYLSVLRPVLSWVMWTAAGSGLLGLTTQLCLVQDILSMLTIHIYCFYVYAARVYSLQVFALRSLWRLFRGKKWNVLRLRVDSALYSMDQLCVGTLLFTVLLFLLPTTLLYYCVFISLRLLVLSVHGILLTVTEVLVNMPVSSIVLRLLGSKCVAGDVLFSVQDKENQGSGNSVTLSMQVIHMPLPKLYSLARTLMKAEPHEKLQEYSWGELLRRVLSGNLVYPWINIPASDNKEKGL